MGKVYVIRRIASDDISSDIWDDTQSAGIDCYPWDENGYKPRAEAKVVASGKAFHILLRAYESRVRAECRNLNDYVCRDSCVEFFLNPDPERDNQYFNFEFNPLGTAYISIGKDRFNRKLLGSEDVRLLCISTSITKENLNYPDKLFWDVIFSVPFSFIEKYYGKIDLYPGTKIKGNFYKCGDDTDFPHYGCWSPIEFDMPDFHRPEFFGDLLIE